MDDSCPRLQANWIQWRYPESVAYKLVGSEHFRLYSSALYVPSVCLLPTGPYGRRSSGFLVFQTIEAHGCINIALPACDLSYPSAEGPSVPPSIAIPVEPRSSALRLSWSFS